MRNDKDYYELLCKNFLAHFWPEKYVSLVKHECPDWISTNVGVEVRRAMENDSGDFDAFKKQYLGKPIDERAKKRLVKNGFSITEIELKSMPMVTLHSDAFGTIILYLPKNSDEYVMAGGVGKGDYISSFADYLRIALEDKLCLLNDHYDLRAENNVCLIIEEQLNYVLLDNLVVDQLLEEIIKNMKKVYSQNEHKYYFDRVYLLFYDNIFDIDTKKWDWSRNTIDQALFSNICSLI